MHLFHKWAKWVDIELTVHPLTSSRDYDYKVVGQRRECQTCGKSQTRRA